MKKIKGWSIVEIVAMLSLVAVSIWLPKQSNVFEANKINSAKSKTESYISKVQSSEILMTSDRVYVPEITQMDLNKINPKPKTIKMKSTQVRFVQMLDVNNVEGRNPASKSGWVVDSVKRLSFNGTVEKLITELVGAERTTPFIELKKGINEFSVVYKNNSDPDKVIRKKLRLVN